MMRVVFPSALAVMCLLSVTGCNSGSSSASNTGGVSLQQLQISPVNPAIANGTTVGLSVTGIYSDHSKADLTSQATWSSSNTGIATITSGASGVTAQSKSPGTTAITAAVGGIKAGTTLTVTNANLAAIDIGPAAPALAAGTKLQLSATGRYSDGTRQDLTSQVTWQSSVTGVATVSGGLLSGVSPGSATVTVTMLVPSPADPTKNIKVQGSTTVTVTGASLTAVRVDPPSPSIADGTTVRLSATGIFSDGSTQDLTGSATWTSSAAGVATVSSGGSAAGLVTSVAAGTATIEASFSGMTGTTTVTVTPAVLTAIGITPVTGALPKGMQRQLTATGTFSDGSTQDVTDQVTWASSKGSVASVGDAAGSYGLVNALTVGSTSIGATLSGVTANVSLNVTGAALVSVNVTPTSPSIADGTSLALTATGNYSDGSTLDITDQVNWATSDDTVAQVSNTAGSAGTVRAESPGSAVISGVLDGKAGTAHLTVTNATLQSIDVTPAAPSVAAGLQVAFTATGHYSNSTTQDVTDQVTWQTSDSSLVAVSNAPGSRGQAVTYAPGTAAVTAQLGTVSGSATVTVTNAQLNAIQVSPASSSLIKGTTVQLSAMGTYTDSSQQDLTSQVTWSSSDGTVASVSNAGGGAGIVTGTGTGQADITASLGSVQGSATVSVSANPDAPVSLTAVASPNVILDNGADTSTITVTVQPADPSGTVADGTVIDFSVTQGTAQLMNPTTTVNGVATVKLVSSTAGAIDVTATVHGTSVSNTASIYATNDLSDAIGKATFAVAPVSGGVVPSGSSFSLYIYNLSNRSFDLNKYEMKDGTNLLSQVTDPQTLNNGGKLLPGQGTGILFSLSHDEPDNGFTATYFLTDQATNTTLTVSKTYALK